MADDNDLARELLKRTYGDPEGPPVPWRRGDALRDLMGPPSYRAPQLRTDALPDLEGIMQRKQVEAAQPGWERWHDDHSQYMRNFMHQATGLVPGLHSAQNAYEAWTDPEHPITQEGSSIPRALGWGAVGLGELALAGVGGLAGHLAKIENRVSLPDIAGKHVAGETPHPLSDSVPALAGFLGLAAPRAAVSPPNPQSINHYFPWAPGAIRPLPRRDAMSDLAAPERPLSGYEVHDVPVDTYHGTGANFDRFDKSASRDFGIHSGTPRAANDRMHDAVADGDGRILPMRLGPQDRPFASLEVKDLGAWDPLLLARELEKRGIRFTEQDFDKLTAAKSLSHDDSRRQSYPIIEDALNRHGVDALRYKNKAEDKGSTSWITWNPETLYSRTSGAQLYGAGAGAAGLTLADLLSRYPTPSPPQ